MADNPVVTPVVNFLVPASGSTNAMIFNQEFPSNPITISFKNKALDGVPFRPYGMIVDNINGSADLWILINEIAYNIVCPAGETIQMPYPAPIDHSVTIWGNDEPASIIFVDYPLIPFILP